MSAQQANQKLDQQSSQRSSQSATLQHSEREGQKSSTALARRGNGSNAPSLLMDQFDIFNLNPFSLFRRMQDELNRMFQANLSAQASNGNDVTAWIPPVELEMRNGNLLVSVELPGVGDEDINVEIINDVLVVSGERKVEREETEGGVRRTERRYGQFYRAVPLPEEAKTGEARAEFKNGVLQITIPMAQDNVRKIPVQASGSQSTTTQSGGQKTGQGSGSTSEKAA